MVGGMFELESPGSWSLVGERISHLIQPSGKWTAKCLEPLIELSHRRLARQQSVREESNLGDEEKKSCG
jgi:hypothetical protein